MGRLEITERELESVSSGALAIWLAKRLKDAGAPVEIRPFAVSKEDIDFLGEVRFSRDEVRSVYIYEW